MEIILITGPTGFIGFKTLLTALEAGYNVRAVIRRPEQAQELKAYAQTAPFVEKLEFVVVPDLTKEGAFDDALSKVTAILHLASPLARETDDYERDIINPAIQMNISLLTSAMKQPTIRRVIITSSMVTLVPFSWLANPDERIYTAKDINSNPSRTVSHAMEAYWTSKALARSAVSEFVATHTPHFKTIQLLPGVVIGPDIRATSTAYLRNNTPLWSLKMSPILGIQLVDPMVSVPVHVADVARAHVDAIKSSIPGDADYILNFQSPGGVEWDDMIEVAKRHFSDRVGTKEMPLGGSLPSMKWRVESRDTEDAFGWTFRTFEQSTRDMIAQYLTLVGAETKSSEK